MRKKEAQKRKRKQNIELERPFCEKEKQKHQLHGNRKHQKSVEQSTRGRALIAICTCSHEQRLLGSRRSLKLFSLKVSRFYKIDVCLDPDRITNPICDQYHLLLLFFSLWLTTEGTEYQTNAFMENLFS